MSRDYSVVIPCWNASKTLAQCIGALKSSTLAPREIIVVDDASTDGTSQLAQSLGAHVVRLSANSGPAVARNIGAREACGEYVVFLDSDVVLVPDALAAADRLFAEKQPDAVTGIYAAEPCTRGWAEDFKARFNHYHFAHRGTIPYEVFDAARAAIRRNVFWDVGGYNEGLRWKLDYENEEFGYRLVQKHTNLLCPEFVGKHYFPSLVPLVRTYFRRVSQWAELFCRRRKFESGGVTTPGTALGTLLAPAFWISAFAAPFHPTALAGTLALLVAFLWCFRGFYLYVGRVYGIWETSKSLLLHLILATVLAAGAGTGILRFMVKR